MPKQDNNKQTENEKSISLSCCANLGYSLTGCAREYPDDWTEDILRIMARRMKECGFIETIPWVDYPPGNICSLEGQKSKTISVAHKKEPFLKRLKRFVELAHAEGLRVQFYFGVGTGILASPRMVNDERCLHVTELGVKYPRFATRGRSGASSFDLVRDGKAGIAFAGLGYPEVRQWLADWTVNTVVSSGADGIQLEPVGMPRDDKGVVPYGYDEPIIADFKREHGQDPLALSNDDESWVNHRCSYTTLLVREIRERIGRLSKPVELSIQCHNLETDHRMFLWPWREWVKEKLVDACHLKTTEPQGYDNLLRKGREWCERRGVRFAGCLDVKEYSQFLTSESIADGVRIILDSGVGQVTIYGLEFTSLSYNPKEAPIERWLKARELLR